MKKLYLIRHAKSDWSNPNLEDFDRPLNKRGEKNAPFMANILKQKNANPDLIISSPAYRAKKTAKIIKKNIAYKSTILFDQHLYEASLKTILEIVNYINDDFDKVFIVGHNPTLNMLAFYLVELNENIPTCGIVEIELSCSSWREVNKKNAKLVSFDYPKKNY